MSPARQTNGSPRRRKIARQSPTEPTLQTRRNSITSSVATKKRHESVLANEKPTPISRAEENECDQLGHAVYKDRGEEDPKN
jgi:hypothetical protein